MIQICEVGLSEQPHPGAIMTGWLRSWICGVTVLLAMTFTSASAAAYSVLTHEELIDLAWNGSIRPLLLARFPGATDAQLVEAHAYAYGGCAIQDMGYYPVRQEILQRPDPLRALGRFHRVALSQRAHHQ